MSTPTSEEHHPFSRAKPLFWFWVIVAFTLLILFLGGILKYAKIPKKWLVESYGVDKKTFNKWVKYFCADLIPDMEAYLKRKTVPLWLFLAIKSRLGNPKEFSILTKKDIIEQGDGNYYSLRCCVQVYTEQFGLLSFEAYRSLKKFPPNISEKMLKQYG